MQKPDCSRPSKIWWKQPFADVLQNRWSWIFRNIHIHMKTPVLEAFLNKVSLNFFIKKRLQYRHFSVNIAKFLRTAFDIEYRWLLSTWPYYILWMIIVFSSCSHNVLCCKHVALLHGFFLLHTFISNARLKLAKSNQILSNTLRKLFTFFLHVTIQK